jgi:PAS domain S-box-containing protein
LTLKKLKETWLMSFFRWIWQSPASDNEWGRFVSGFFHKTLLITLLMMLLLLSSVHLNPNADSTRLPTLYTLMLANIFCFLLLKRNQMRYAVHMFIWVCWLIVGLSSLTSIGVYTPAYLICILLILVSGLALSNRSTILLTALVIGFGLPMLYGHSQGWIITPTNHNLSPLSMWITTSTIFLALAYVVIAVRRTSFSIAERLHQKQDFYRAILEDQTELIVRWKEGGIRTFANSAYLRYFGISLEEAIGTNFFPHITEDDRQWIAAKIARLSPEKPIDIDEHRVIRPDGTTGWQEWSDRAFYDEAGKVIEYQSVGRDITALKDLEERQRELALSKEREAFLRDFLSTMSHDLQTPLSVMRTNLHMLKRTPEKTEERIEKIDRQIDKLSGMIDDILTVARLEHSPELERRPTELAPILESCLSPLRDEAKAKNIELQSPEPLPSALLQADAMEFQRALSNLLSNAIKYTPAGGQVRLESHQQADKLIIEIADTGIGIDSEDLPHIFERFYRAKNAKDFEKGTGLGLAIVKRIIELHEGSISASSTVGKGSRFHIEIPLLQQGVMA